MTLAYPEQLAIPPLAAPPRAQVRVPGSKSLTNRALVLAALAEPSAFGSASILEGALHSEDTEVMVECLRRLGIPVKTDWQHERLTVPCLPWSSWASEADLFVGNSGTTMRFLTALAALGPGRYRLDGIPRMRERPIEGLLAALRQLGVNAYSESGNGCPPVIVEGGGLRGGTVHLKGDVSSQFLSGLMMVAPFAEEDITILVEGGLVSLPYVQMTALLMEDCEIRLEGDVLRSQEIHRITIPGKQQYPARRFTIEPDASAASYFFAAAAITQGEVTVLGQWHPQMQGDLQFLRLLEAMGCTVRTTEEGITVQGGKELRGIDADMNAISDTVMTLAAVACFAAGPTTIRNVAHIRHKESDRLHALTVELRKAGAGVEERPDGLLILPCPLHGATLDTYNDHRLAMSLALLGLRTPGVVIRHPGCVAKTYPHFFADLDLLRSPASF
jgi:3-phosphoshikimate 1-carboxyvinyltransferase